MLSISNGLYRMAETEPYPLRKAERLSLTKSTQSARHHRVLAPTILRSQPCECKDARNIARRACMALPQCFDEDVFCYWWKAMMPRVRDPILQDKKSVI